MSIYSTNNINSLEEFYTKNKSNYSELYFSYSNRTGYVVFDNAKEYHEYADKYNCSGNILNYITILEYRRRINPKSR